MVAAGATRFLVAFPDEKLIQCWNFDPLKRRGGISPSPIDGRLKTLALGSDSDGPALVLWSREGPFVGAPDTQFSFLDLDSLAVLRVGLIAARALGQHLHHGRQLQDQFICVGSVRSGTPARSAGGALSGSGRRRGP